MPEKIGNKFVPEKIGNRFSWKDRQLFVPEKIGRLNLKIKSDRCPSKFFCRKNQNDIFKANRQENFFKGKSSRDYAWGHIVKRLCLRANRQENMLEGKSSRDYYQGQIVKRIFSRANRQENMFKGQIVKKICLKANPLEKIFTKNSRRIL